MLQRSPSYVMPVPAEDPVLRELHRIMKPGGRLLIYVYETFERRPLPWRIALSVVNGPHRFRVVVVNPGNGDLPLHLIDTKIRVTGACGPVFNEKRFTYHSARLGGDPALFIDPIHIPVNYDYIFAKDAQ
mgnify:CR=1 FL=1